MKIYLDNCCFNRPFDSQTSMPIKLETEAKLHIQQLVWDKKADLVWSYVLDYENSANPYLERRAAIGEWKRRAVSDIEENPEILAIAVSVGRSVTRPPRHGCLLYTSPSPRD